MYMINPIIKQAIKKAGTQAKLAESCGLSQAAIHKLLTRKTKSMRVSTAVALAKATGIPVEKFIR